MQTSDYPHLFTVADTRARHAQLRYTRLVRVDLILLVLASLFGAAANFTSSSAATLVTILSAVSLAAAISLETATRLFHLERHWYENRSVAESVKTATWRYIMHVDPFDRSDADAFFVRTLAETASTGSHVAARFDLPLEESHQITGEMRRLHGQHMAQRKETYLADRLLDQVSWYTMRSRQRQRSATVWFWIGIGARVAALVFAILTIFLPFAGERFVELFAAIAAASTAWTELGRHEEQAKTYGNAAHELHELIPMVRDAPDERTLVARVVDAEGAMSREYTLWMVKRS